MKFSKLLSLALMGAAAASPSLRAAGTKFGTIEVTQLANNANNLTQSPPPITLAFGPGSTTGVAFQNTSSRGDYELDFGTTTDSNTGMLHHVDQPADPKRQRHGQRPRPVLSLPPAASIATQRLANTGSRSTGRTNTTALR